jgi:uncharacterized protein (DUF58 family)
MVSTFRSLRRGTAARLWRFELPGCRAEVRLRQPLLPAIWLLALIWYAAYPEPPAVMAVTALGGLLLAGYLWARTLARGLRGERRLRYAAFQVGDEMEEEVRLQDPTLLPALWVEFTDHSNLPGCSINSIRAVSGYGELKWRPRAICTRRGVFTLGPWELHTGDPFGLFSVRQVYSIPQEILVYPPLALLPQQLLPHFALPGDRRPLRQALVAETISAAAPRPWQTGDPLRRVHWRTTARLGTTHVKTFDPEATTTAWIIPDFETSGHGGEGVTSSEDKLVILCASLSAQLLAGGLAVGLITGVGGVEELRVAAPAAGQTHFWLLLRMLAALHPYTGLSFRMVLERAVPLVGGRSAVLALTTSTSPDWPPALSRLAGRGAAALLLDPAAYSLPPIGEPFRRRLVELGIAAAVIDPAAVHPIEASYGALQRWEFSASPTGRAVVRRTPRSVAFTGNP